FFGVADYLIQPLIVLVTAPFLVSRLGAEQYGIWMLANALAGTIGIFSTGLGDATTRYVSASIGRNDVKQATQILRATLTLSIVVGGFVAFLLFVLAPPRVDHLVRTNREYPHVAVGAVQVSGRILMLRSIDSVFVGALRAQEQSPPAVKVATL